MFSPASGEPAPNRLTDAVARRAACADEPFIDLTESNPTRAGFDYPADLLAPLADPRGLRYAPAPLGSIDGAARGGRRLRAPRHRRRRRIASC